MSKRTVSSSPRGSLGARLRRKAVPVETVGRWIPASPLENPFYWGCQHGRYWNSGHQQRGHEARSFRTHTGLLKVTRLSCSWVQVVLALSSQRVTGFHAQVVSQVSYCGLTFSKEAYVPGLAELWESRMSVVLPAGFTWFLPLPRCCHPTLCLRWGLLIPCNSLAAPTWPKALLVVP